jgi:hypothetical protein
MNNLKIKNHKSGGTLALFEKDSCLSVSQCVCEIVKLSGFERPQKIFNGGKFLLIISLKITINTAL